MFNIWFSWCFELKTGVRGNMGKTKKQGFNLVRWCRQQAILRTFSKHTIIETPTHTQLVSVSMNIQKWNSTRLRTKTSCCELRNIWCSMLFRFGASTWRISSNIPAFKRMREVQTFWRKPQCTWESKQKTDITDTMQLKNRGNIPSTQIHLNKFFTLVNGKKKLNEMKTKVKS